MGNACTSEHEMARTALGELIAGGDLLARGDVTGALRCFDRGLRLLPSNEYVTADVTTSAESANAGMEEAAAAVIKLNKQADTEVKIRRHQSKSLLKEASPVNRNRHLVEADAFKNVVSQMRRATRLYGNAAMGMDLYDLERAIGGDASQDVEDDAVRKAECEDVNPLSRRPAGAHGDSEILAASLRIRRRRETVLLVEANDAEVSRSHGQLTATLPETGAPSAMLSCVSRRKSSGVVHDIDSSPLEASTVVVLGPGGESDAKGHVPIITMTQPSTGGVDREDAQGPSSVRFWVGVGQPTIAVDSVDDTPSDPVTTPNARAECVVEDRRTLAMSIHGEWSANSNPLLAPKSAIALFRVQDAHTIEAILRVLQYRLMVGDTFFVHGLLDQADEQYLMVSGATLFIRMKETLIYIQTQSQRIHERACLGISAVALERARRAVRPSDASGDVGGDCADVNRYLAIALQHSVSVRRAEASNNEVVADVLRTPYNLSREAYAPLSVRPGPGERNDSLDGLMDEADLAREELRDKVKRKADVVAALMSNGAFDAHKARNMLSAQMGEGLRGVAGTHSCIVCRDGTRLWASVPLIDALRLEAEARLEMILLNNPPHEVALEPDEDTGLVGTREDCQSVVSGLQKAVGLCVSQYSTQSPEYRKMKGVLIAARRALRWTPAALAKPEQPTVPFVSAAREYRLRRKSVGDVLGSVSTRHNNFVGQRQSLGEDGAFSSRNRSPPRECNSPTTRSPSPYV